MLLRIRQTLYVPQWTAQVCDLTGCLKAGSRQSISRPPPNPEEGLWASTGSHHAGERGGLEGVTYGPRGTSCVNRVRQGGIFLGRAGCASKSYSSCVPWGRRTVCSCAFSPKHTHSRRTRTGFVAATCACTRAKDRSSRARGLSIDSPAYVISQYAAPHLRQSGRLSYLCITQHRN